VRGVRVKEKRSKAKRAMRALAEIAKAKIEALEEKVRFLSMENQQLKEQISKLREGAAERTTYHAPLF